MLLALCAREWLLLPDGRAHLSILNIGQGDSILLTTPQGHRILIDGGPDLTTLEELGRHLPFFDRHIDLLVLSHPHIDHIASFPPILERYQVDAVLMNNTQYGSPRYQHFLSLLRTEHIPVMEPDTHGAIVFDDGFILERLWPPHGWFGAAPKNVHDAMVVLRAHYKNHTALLTGDLEAKYEAAILKLGTDVHADILKIGHHGSLTSTSTGFLVAVHPSLAVISAGKDNPFGHPRPQTLTRLAHFHIPIKRTDRDGTIEIVWE